MLEQFPASNHPLKFGLSLHAKSQQYLALSPISTQTLSKSSDTIASSSQSYQEKEARKIDALLNLAYPSSLPLLSNIKCISYPASFDTIETSFLELPTLNFSLPEICSAKEKEFVDSTKSSPILSTHPTPAAKNVSSSAIPNPSIYEFSTVQPLASSESVPAIFSSGPDKSEREGLGKFGLTVPRPLCLPHSSSWAERKREIRTSMPQLTIMKPKLLDTSVIEQKPQDFLVHLASSLIKPDLIIGGPKANEITSILHINKSSPIMAHVHPSKL
ncbi:hypothetical protein GH714_037049 [Hevea brasiliensis]|uniref:Uncharacterized protein n=1 Tax=Hevea brasiliensis TaxID=3981 RepID=A0A6A6LNA3_HEVBR|nr:hypothetical protein GH714_037049 [Hevea brasiliensis]